MSKHIFDSTEYLNKKNMCQAEVFSMQINEEHVGKTEILRPNKGEPS